MCVCVCVSVCVCVCVCVFVFGVGGEGREGKGRGPGKGGSDRQAGRSNRPYIDGVSKGNVRLRNVDGLGSCYEYISVAT